MKSSKKIRVWLASDLKPLRSRLYALLMDNPTLECIGNSALDAAALGGIVVAQPDVLIVDLDTHNRRTGAVLKRLLSQTPHTRIIALSAIGDKRFILRLLRSGVLGYISYVEATQELRQAIEAVARGDVFLCPSASIALLDEYRKRACRCASNGLASGRQSKSRDVHPKTG